LRKFPGIITVLLLFMIVATPVPASVPLTTGADTPQTLGMSSSFLSQVTDTAAATLTAGQPMTDTVSSILLPVVLRDYRGRPPCSVESPFTLQIAALHQIVPGAGQTLTAKPLTEAEWLALYEESFPSLVQALAESGACWSRVRINWSWIQPDPPPTDYVWGPYHDDKLALVAGTGVRLIATIDDVPEWARGAPYSDLSCTHIDADYLDEFAQFLTDLVTRYKEPPWNIHHWELRNEPDGTTRDRANVGQGCGGFRGDLYAQMLAVAYPAIKAADPTAMVLMGGVAHDWFTDNYPTDPDGPFYRYFPDEVMANGGEAYLDAINFHYFHDFHREWERWDPGSPDRQFGWLPAPTCGDVFDGDGTEYDAWGIDLIAKTTHFRNRLATCFEVNKPVWVTELAEHGYASDPAALVQQARYVIQGYARGLAAGVENITWFALVTPPGDPSEQGLLFDDLSPKPAYYAYQTLTRELWEYEYVRTLAISGVEGYVFRNAYQQEKTVAWSSDPDVPADVTFSVTSRLRVADRTGKVTYVVDGGPGDQDGVQNGSVSLQVAADPLFASK
jgi:hypothetical protein